MRLIKCDRCRKTIKSGGVTAGYDVLERVDLCAKCGKLIDLLLKKYKLLRRHRKSK